MSTLRLCAALVATGLGLACSQPAQRPDILLISVDSLRPDHLGAYGYPKDTSPTLDWLAREGVLFEQAVSSTSWTLPAHASLFTGLYDPAHGVMTDADRLVDSHQTLAERLRAAGYQTAGFYGAPYLHPTFGMAQGFDVYEGYNRSGPRGETDWNQVGDAPFRAAVAAGALESGKRVTGPLAAAAVQAWTEQRMDARPYFLFLHLWDVHYDYAPPPRYVELFDPGYTGSLDASDYFHNRDVHAGMHPRDLQHLIALYDGEIRSTDDTLAAVLEALDEAGRLDGTLVVFTADHGEEFFEHDDKGHRKSLYDEVLRIPLVVWWPGQIQSGLRVADQVRLIDVLPTLLSAAGVAPPTDVQGRDLTPLLRGGDLAPAPALAELNATFTALREDGQKWISNERNELYFDLAKDPRELRPLRPPARAAALKQQTEALLSASQAIRASHAAPQTPAAPIDESVREELRALGYLEP